MKIYKVQDDYRAITKWCGTIYEANRTSQSFAKELELTECCVNDGADWVSIDKITNKRDLIDALNQRG